MSVGSLGMGSRLQRGFRTMTRLTMTVLTALADERHSRQDVAEELGVSVRTVDRLIRSGRLPAIHIGYRVWVTSTALEHYMETNYRQPPLPFDGVPVPRIGGRR